ncbi:hypothetical protein L484_004866 [Morus notabilis]|uniref:Uncharacterized protein n=1 Tax=Morus notabilis TaxID=981085 RepID=W9R172_9ROSA|nr:hypothetical protein L484_004866 [Morus notabilis]
MLTTRCNAIPRGAMPQSCRAGRAHMHLNMAAENAMPTPSQVPYHHSCLPKASSAPTINKTSSMPALRHGFQGWEFGDPPLDSGP